MHEQHSKAIELGLLPSTIPEEKRPSSVPQAPLPAIGTALPLATAVDEHKSPKQSAEGAEKVKTLIDIKESAEIIEQQSIKKTTRAKRIFQIIGEVLDISGQILGKVTYLRNLYPLATTVSTIFAVSLGFIFSKIVNCLVNREKRKHIAALATQGDTLITTLTRATQTPNNIDIQVVDRTGFWNMFGTKSYVAISSFKELMRSLIFLTFLTSPIVVMVLDNINGTADYVPLISAVLTIIYAAYLAFINYLEQRNLAKAIENNTRRVELLQLLHFAPVDQRLSMIKAFKERQKQPSAQASLSGVTLASPPSKTSSAPQQHLHITSTDAIKSASSPHPAPAATTSRVPDSETPSIDQSKSGTSTEKQSMNPIAPSENTAFFSHTTSNTIPPLAISTSSEIPAVVTFHNDNTT